MSTPPPEFSRIVRLDEIGDRPRTITLEADAEERAALARRFGLIALDSLSGEAAVARVAGGVHATGTLSAHAVQPCVATAEPVPARIDEPFDLRFIEEGDLAAEEEIELSEADCDVIGYSGASIDLGEALAQTLALALPPFPRSPNADAALRDAGVLSEEEAGPFGALAGLKDALKPKPD